jgi:putative transposase
VGRVFEAHQQRHDNDRLCLQERTVSDYRRYYLPGGTFFFTIVTHRRKPILTTELERRCLRAATRKIQLKWPFKIVAIVLLPEHLHCVWSLPRGDDKYPKRWSGIKEEFTRRYLRGGGREASQSPSRAAHRQRGIWQRRYWEHTIEDEEDLKHCIDYIHSVTVHTPDSSDGAF